MFIVTSVYMIAEKAADVILTAAGHGSLPKCVYNTGFWCKLRNRLCGVAGIVGAVLHFFAPAAKVLLGAAATLAAVLLVIVTLSWFVFEPPPAQPDPLKEQATIGKIVTLFTDELKAQYPPHAYARATHPTGNACVKADVTVNADQPPRLNVGFLAGKPDGNRVYKSWIRFSNAADRTRDSRSMAIKLFGVSGDRLPFPGDEDDTQDLLFDGYDAFLAGDPQQFYGYFDACRKGGGSCSAWRNPFVAWHLLTHPRGAYNLWKGGKAYPTIQSIKWSSVAPFTLGDAQVKYGATPCTEQVHYGKPGDTSFYLLQRMQERLDPRNDNHICLDLRVQIRNDAHTQPIENTLVAWKGHEAGWLKVARIDIYPQSFSSPAQQEFCDELAFNPFHSLTVHRPLGGINRVRGKVMEELENVRYEGPMVGNASAPMN